MRNRLFLIAMAMLPFATSLGQGIVHDPANMANNIVMQAESMEEAIEQKLVMTEQLTQFTEQLEMMKDKADKFKKIAGMIAACVEIIDGIEYGTNAFKKVTELREYVTEFEDLSFEDKYMCIMTLVDCGYVITQDIKAISKLKEQNDAAEGTLIPEINKMYIRQIKEDIKSEVVRAICCVDDFMFKSHLQSANYDMYCAGLCMRRAKTYWKNGKHSHFYS